MRIMMLIVSILLLLGGCFAPLAEQKSSMSAEVTTPPPVTAQKPRTDSIDAFLRSMTTEEKVGQLFLARYSEATAASHTGLYHLGGFILFSDAFRSETPASVSAEIAALQSLSSVPLLMAVDEEGGTVTGISRYPAFRSFPFPSPRSLYESGGTQLLLETETEKCRLLSSLGLNVNMGPVCDISTEPGAFMYDPSLGLDPASTSAVTASIVETMNREGIGSVLKHFPGYGSNANTHAAIARDSRPLEVLEAADLIPFAAGIRAGCGAILVSHAIVEALDSTFPASLSPAVISYLRNEMDFDGVVMTDDLAMQAITDVYGAEEAAVLAVLAGCDMLCATDYAIQYKAVLQAVQEGRIPMTRIDEAASRVLRWKQQLGLLEF